jgi:beta-catenin-like protein 1
MVLLPTLATRLQRIPNNKLVSLQARTNAATCNFLLRQNTKTMTSVDDLFKKPFLPSTNGAPKRKFKDQDAQAAYKSAKLDHDDNPSDEDMEAGPELPPEEDEDDEGRFFGSGTNQHTTLALDFVDRADDGDTAFKAEKIDAAWVRRLGLSFERKITKNSELRAKYEDDASKFAASEGDLDAEIKSLSILSEHADLYAEFAKIGCAASLVSLLAHENTDIAIDAVEIMAELLDDDVEAEQSQWDALVEGMLDADLLDLLVSNLARLDESVEADRSGVYHSLSVLEDLASNPATASRIAKTPAILSYLLTRISTPEPPSSTTISQNKQYSAEVLQVLSQSSPDIRSLLISPSHNAIDTLLQLLSTYRKRDPQPSTTEYEYAENIFDTLTCLLTQSAPLATPAFYAAEGTELMLLMLRQPSKFTRPRALRVLDHALAASSSFTLPVAEKLVDAAGLKPLFSVFMKNKGSDVAVVTEHVLGIFSSLLRSLPGNSSHRIRTLAKFVEKDYQALHKLIVLRWDFASRQTRNAGSDNVDDGAVLYCLDTLHVILAWLVAEDAGARKRVVQELASRDEGLHVLKESLSLQLEGVDGDEEGNVAEMLAALIECL